MRMVQWVVPGVNQENGGRGSDPAMGSAWFQDFVIMDNCSFTGMDSKAVNGTFFHININAHTHAYSLWNSL